MDPQTLSSLTNYISQAESVLVALPANPTFDQQLAASSLFLSLRQHEREVSLVGVKKIVNPTIAGLDRLKTQVGSNNLVISFDYDPQAVDNVGYHLDEENNRFYLTVKPKRGSKPLDKETVELDYAGADADLIVVFGIDDLEDLQQLYFGYEDLYEGANLISVGSSRPIFQSNHVDTAQASSCCESIYHLLNQANMKPSDESATNLLAGIQYQTNNFVDPKADANTFEVVAGLLRLGARRKAGAFVGVGEKEEVEIENSSDVEDRGLDQQFEEDSKREGEVFKNDDASLEKIGRSITGAKGGDGASLEQTQKSTPVRPSGLKK